MLTARKVEPGDRELLNEAAKNDFYHAAAGLTGDHWADGDSIVYSDDEGVVLALATTAVARVDIQFIASHKRNRETLMQGFWPYIRLLKDRGYKEVIFTTNSASVINFFKKRFNFRYIGGNTYSLRIA